MGTTLNPNTRKALLKGWTAYIIEVKRSDGSSSYFTKFYQGDSSLRKAFSRFMRTPGVVEVEVLSRMELDGESSWENTPWFSKMVGDVRVDDVITDWTPFQGTPAPDSGAIVNGVKWLSPEWVQFTYINGDTVARHKTARIMVKGRIGT